MEVVRAVGSEPGSLDRLESLAPALITASARPRSLVLPGGYTISILLVPESCARRRVSLKGGHHDPILVVGNRF